MWFDVRFEIAWWLRRLADRVCPEAARVRDQLRSIR